MKNRVAPVQRILNANAELRVAAALTGTPWERVVEVLTFRAMESLVGEVMRPYEDEAKELRGLILQRALLGTRN